MNKRLQSFVVSSEARLFWTKNFVQSVVESKGEFTRVLTKLIETSNSELLTLEINKFVKALDINGDGIITIEKYGNICGYLIQ